MKRAKTLFFIQIIVFALLFFQSAFAFQCHEIFKKDKNVVLSFESFIGRSVSVQDTLSYILSHLPAENQATLQEKISQNFNGIGFGREAESPRDIRLVYRNRLLDYRLSRANNAKIAWFSGTVKTKEEFDVLIDKTIDLVTEAEFLPIRMTSIYRAHQSRFIRNNVELMVDRVMYKMFMLDPQAPLPQSTALNRVMIYTKSLLYAVLPLHFAELRSIRLTEDHRNAFKKGGPQELYKLLKRRHGAGLAIKYWLNHLAMAKIILIAAYASFLAPEVWNVYNYLVEQQSILLTDTQPLETATRMLEAMRSPPDQILTSIQNHLSTLPTAEADILQQFIDQSMDSFPVTTELR